MKNYWLNKLRIGRRVRYKGLDQELNGKIGYIVKFTKTMYTNIEWVDVQFEFTDKIVRTKIISVEKDNLEII